jgi:3-dehydroquinate synthase
MNRTISSTFQVRYSYDLHFTRRVFDEENPLLADLVARYRPGQRVKILFVLDEGMAARHMQLKVQIPKYCDRFNQQLECTSLVEIPGGESAKNDPAHVEEVLSQINEKGICRHSIVVVVGGGAVIDMAGYAAAIAHRGIQIIRIPTTVLSQNDAAVGVKNGINYFGKKNFIGTFAVPLAIINDSDFLSTLHPRDWVAGTAEAVKVALIKDRPFFEYLENQASAINEGDLPAMEELIYRCAKLHMEHIARGGDPFERGSARPLDFGHWAAHKLEHLTGYALRHGEAVAIGMALDVHYARLVGFISSEEQDRILKLLQLLGFGEVLQGNTQISEKELLKGLDEFREHLGGTLCITLPEGIGNKVEVNTIDRDLMKQAIKEVFFHSTQKKIPN